MSESMVERVARAMTESRQSHTKWEDCAESFRDLKRLDARAAIEAMRVPTEGMRSAFADEVHESADAKWQAMIDEALK